MENKPELKELKDYLRQLKESLPSNWGQTLSERTGYKPKTVYACLSCTFPDRKPNFRIINEAIKLYKESLKEGEELNAELSEILK